MARLAPLVMRPLDVDSIIQAVTAEGNRVEAQRQLWMAQPAAKQMADLISTRYAMAPWMPPDLVGQLSLAGIDDQTFGAAADASAREQLNHGVAVTMAQQEDLDRLMNTPGNLLNDREQQLQGLLLQGRKAGASDEQLRQALGQAEPTTQLNQQNRDILATLGKSIRTKETRPGPFGWGPVDWGLDRLQDVGASTPVKAASRTATGILQSGMEFAQNQAAGFYRGGANIVNQTENLVRDGDFNVGKFASGVWNVNPLGALARTPAALEATTAGQGVSQLVNQGKIDAGSGFFVQGALQQDQADRAREVRGTTAYNPLKNDWVDLGRAWTPGNAYAATVFEPGTMEASWTSGLIDAVFNVGLDPANKLTPGWAGNARNLPVARRFLTPRGLAGMLAPGEASRLREAVDAKAFAKVLRDQAEAGAGQLNLADIMSIRNAADLVEQTGLPRAAGVGGQAAVDDLLRRTGVTAAREHAPEEWRKIVDTSAGVIAGSKTQTLYVPRALRWAYSNGGRKVVERVEELAGQPTKINMLFGGKLDDTLAVALADARTPDKILGVLGNAFSGGEIRTLPSLAATTAWSGRVGGGVTIRSQLTSTLRLAGSMPTNSMLDPDDPMAWRNMFDLLGNANVTGADREALLDDFMRARASGNRAAIYDVVDRSMNGVKDELRRAGWNEHDLAGVFDWRGAMGRENRRLAEDLLDGVDPDPIWNSQDPMFLSEALNSKIQLYDPRELRNIRRDTSAWAPFKTARAFAKVTGLPLSKIADIQSKWWKPLVLLRPAYLTRVVGEELVRVMVGDAGWEHPLAYFEALRGHGLRTDATGEIFGLRRQWEKLDNKIGRLERGGKDTTDLVRQQEALVGKIMGGVDEQYGEATIGYARDRAAAFAKRDVQLTDDKLTEYMARTHNWLSAEKMSQPSQWKSGMSDGLVQLNNDPIARRLAHGGLLDEDLAGVENPAQLQAGIEGMVDWLYQGDGRKWWDQWLTMRPGVPDNPQAVRKWLDTQMSVINNLTGNRPDLLQVIEDGTFQGRSAFQLGRFNRYKVSDDLRKYLEDFRVADESPARIRYNQREFDPKDMVAARSREMKDTVMTWFFGGLYGRSSDYLNRSPVFRREYWRRVSEMGTQLSPSEAQKMLAKVEGAGLTQRLKLAVTTSLNNAVGTGTVKGLDSLAKGYALDYTRDLLYDATKRSQFMDVWRVVFPFGDAWKELLTVWGRQLTTNPRAINSVRKTIVAARGADPDGDGQGFFYQDPTSNQWSFNYPAVGHLAKLATGVDTQFVGNVAGLSIGTQVLPGIGPVMAYGVQELVRHVPQQDQLLNLLFPFGSPEERDPHATPLSELLKTPGWVDKVGAFLPIVRGMFNFSDADQNATFGNTYNEVASALVASGKYDMRNPDEVNQLKDDAMGKARILSLFRGLTQAVGPTSPKLAYQVATHDGDVPTALLVEDFQNLSKMYGYDKAVPMFLDRYGDDAFIYMTGKTQATVPGLVTSDAFVQWEQQNGHLFDSYPDIAGYYGPSGTGDSLKAFNYFEATGQRKQKGFQQRLNDGEDLVGRWIYSQMKAKIPGKLTDEDRAWLSAGQKEITQLYPGYNPEGSEEFRATLGRQFNQLQRAVADPNLADTDVGKALGIYWARRDEVLHNQVADKVSNSSRTVSSSAKGRVYRDYLRQVGEALSERYPDFRRLWDGVLVKEIPQDPIDEQVQAANELATNQNNDTQRVQPATLNQGVSGLQGGGT